MGRILLEVCCGSADDVIRAGGIELDKAAHIVTLEGEALDLSFKEFELLSYFYGEPGDCPVQREDSQ